MTPLKVHFKNLINRPLEMMGLELTRKDATEQNLIPHWYERLMHIKNLGFSPEVIFDCGAFKGRWTMMISKIFPNAQFVMMEPNKNLLDEIRANISGIRPAPLLLEIAVGEEFGKGHLNIWDNEETSIAGSSLLSHVQGEPATRVEIEIHTLDMISNRTGFVPDLVKLDLQGYEFAALQGATNILQKSELFIIEFSCLEAYQDGASPRDLMDIMYDNHYVLYDVIDLHYRTFDGALCRGDFFFIKNDSFLRKYKGYSGR